jgi:ABC-type phosphate transport system substrate-binding protein
MRVSSACVGVLLAAHASSFAMAEPVRLVGATTFTSEIMEPNRELIESQSGQKVLLLPSRSAQGVLALFEGDHIAMSSATTDNIVAELKKSHPLLPYDQLRTFNISRARAAFSVNLTNPVRHLDSSSLPLVLIGKIDNWKQLGWQDRPIRLVMVRAGGGVQLTIETQLGIKVAADQTIRVQISSQVNKVVEQELGALGLAQIENIKHQHVAELTTDGLFEQELNLVTLGAPTPAAQAVIDAVVKIVADKRLHAFNSHE